MTDSRADIKAMLRSYLADAEATYLDAVATNTLDEAVHDRLVDDVRRVCEEMVADGNFEHVGIIRKPNTMGEQGYRLADPDGALAAEGYSSIPNTAREIAEMVFPLAFRPRPRHYGRWEDAMIEQLRLHEFISSHGGREYMKGFEAGMNEKHPVSKQVPDGLLHAIQEETLHAAEPVYVGADVCELIDAARGSFQIESVLPSDPFVPAGFCLLATPIMLHDVPGTNEEMVPVRAISWMSIHSEDLSVGSFWISFYARMDEVPNPRANELAKDWVGHPIFIAHMFQWQWGERPLGERLDIIAIPGEDPDAAHARATEQGQLVQNAVAAGPAVRAGQATRSTGPAPRGAAQDEAQPRRRDRRAAAPPVLRRRLRPERSSPHGLVPRARLLGHPAHPPGRQAGVGQATCKRKRTLQGDDSCVGISSLRQRLLAGIARKTVQGPPNACWAWLGEEAAERTSAIPR